MIHILHGINTKDPMDNVGRLKPFFIAKGMGCRVHDYGFVPFGVAWLVNWWVSRQMLKEVQDGDSLVMHSNGAAIGLRVARKRKIKVAVLINAALDSNIRFPNTEAQVVFFIPKDKVVKWAKYIPWHVWGDMGRVGYTGKDDNVIQFNCGRVSPKLSRHADFFARGKLNYWGEVTAQIVYDLQ